MKDIKISEPIADLVKLIAEITVRHYISEQKEQRTQERTYDQSKYLHKI